MEDWEEGWGESKYLPEEEETESKTPAPTPPPMPVEDYRGLWKTVITIVASLFGGFVVGFALAGVQWDTWQWFVGIFGGAALAMALVAKGKAGFTKQVATGLVLSIVALVVAVVNSILGIILYGGF